MNPECWVLHLPVFIMNAAFGWWCVFMNEHTSG